MSTTLFFIFIESAYTLPEHRCRHFFYTFLLRAGANCKTTISELNIVQEFRKGWITPIPYKLRTFAGIK
ncbi:hypothetical protein [Pontibacter ramchanderi]|uniref:hypothetical protein n=1 Tax=Pontibacter ramchanderi TaxID=1179743 RepID=UPI000C709F7C|nr:hypothetical protein [Pontibacter ramchanderi]